MSYLLDTNIISELRKNQPSKEVIDWISDINSDELFISCLTIGEIKTGIIKLSSKDKVTSKALDKWLNEILQNYRENILNIDMETSLIWSELMSIDNNNAIDGLIAAQAINHRMTLVTRNMKHYNIYNIKLLNPFE